MVEVASAQRLTTRHTLKHSKNSDIGQLWLDTSYKNISVDVHLEKSQNLNQAKKSIKLVFENAALSHVNSLQIQGASVNSLMQNLSSKLISNWAKLLTTLSATLFCFTRKGLQQQLATSSNLHRWGKGTTPLCLLCKQPQTNKHVLNNCAAPVALERYTIRHDAVLQIICNWLKQHIPQSDTLHADLSGGDYKPVGDVFNDLRPDIVIVSGSKIHVLELTICHETNLENSRKYKTTKYNNIRDKRKEAFLCRQVELFTVEVTSLGLMQDLTDFTTSLTIPKLPDSVYKDIVHSVISNSYGIYRNRNNNS